MVSAVQIRLLGPVDVVVRGVVARVGGPMIQALLAALAIDVGHTVPTERLIEDLWGEAPPDSASAGLQSYVSSLRRLLGHEAIVSEDHCYQLDLHPDVIDAVRFERLLVAAEESVDTDPLSARDSCARGLALWRGPAFGNLCDRPFLRLAAERLEELRLATMEVMLRADLTLGHHAHVIPQLEVLVEDFPYRERVWYLLIDALARDGRRVEALRTVRRLERILAESGLEPAHEVRLLEQEIIDEVPPHDARLSTEV